MRSILRMAALSAVASLNERVGQMSQTDEWTVQLPWRSSATRRRSWREARDPAPVPSGHRADGFCVGRQSVAIAILTQKVLDRGVDLVMSMAVEREVPGVGNQGETAVGCQVSDLTSPNVRCL